MRCGEKTVCGPSRGLVRVFGRLLILVLSLVAAGVLGEIVVRVRYGRAMGIFPRYVTGASYGDFQIRRNIPGARYTHRSPDGVWEFRINSQGFRDDRTFALSKPGGMFRVLALGDSFTVGFEVRQDQTYSAVLERELKRRGLRAEAINAGVSGFGNAEELIFLREEGLKYAPDVVVLAFFENDFEDNIRSDLYRLREGKLELNTRIYLPAIRARDFLNSFLVYRWLSEHSYLHSFLNTHATLAVRRRVLERAGRECMGADPADSAKSIKYRKELATALLAAIRDVCWGAGACFVILDVPVRTEEGLRRSLGLDDETIATLCDRYLDPTGALAALPPESPAYRQHGQRHWSEKGHEIAGRMAADAIIELVREKAERWKSESH